jgi:hypothetical protein
LGGRKVEVERATTGERGVERVRLDVRGGDGDGGACRREEVEGDGGCVRRFLFLFCGLFRRKGGVEAPPPESAASSE